MASPHVTDVDALLEEQVRYYRARAPEYDATSLPEGAPFAQLTRRAHAALAALGPVDRVIELGAGTGQWTRQLARIAGEVEAVDTSPEVLALNARKVGAANVRYTTADVFAWRPDRRADLVVFGALLSHIPRDRFAPFWDAVRAMLGPGGRAWVFDESPVGLSPEEETPTPDVVVRTLEDGRRFRIVKIRWDAAELTERLRALGWRAALTQDGPFYWGTITPG